MMTPDFTGGGIHALPTETRSIGNAQVDQRIHDLVRDYGCNASSDFIQEMIVTALKIGRDGLNEADLKLFNRSLRELRHAARVFSRYTDRQKVVVFGSARTPPNAPEALAAEEFGRKISERGFMLITGGGNGIMGAAQRGAGRDNSFGLNIRLPFEQHANPTIDGDNKLITFNYFFTRKLNFVKETHAVALFPGGFGTLDEGFEVLTLMQTGKARIFPIVFVDQPGGTYWKAFFAFLENHLQGHGLVSPEDFNFFRLVTSVDEAVEEIAQFYRNYCSYRWVRQQIAVRLRCPLTAKALKTLNRNFADLLVCGNIEASGPLPEEANQPELAHLPRLVFTPRRDHLGRLRALIDAINLAPCVR
ncbi:MAG: TIGR00730 family Rossman fold protein [Verrucomicrobiota bacterium]